MYCVSWLIFALGLVAVLHGIYRLICWKIYTDVVGAMEELAAAARIVLEETGQSKGKLWATLSGFEGSCILVYVQIVNRRQKLGKWLGLRDLRGAIAIADTMKTIVNDACLTVSVPGFLEWLGSREIEKKFQKSVSDGVAAFDEQARMKRRRSAVEAMWAATSFALGGLIIGLHSLFL